MKTPDSASPTTAVSRLKDRLLGSSPSPKDDVKASVPAVVPKPRMRFPARVAEFLLVFRLRARRSARSSDILQRAVQVVLVTCRHWFGGSERPKRDSEKRY